MVNMNLNDKLQSVKKSELTNVTSNFNGIESLYNEFQVRLNNIADSELVVLFKRALTASC